MTHSFDMQLSKETKTTAVYQAKGDVAVSTVYVNKTVFKDGKPTDKITMAVTVPE